MGGAVGGGFSSAPLGTVKGEEGRERVGNVTRWAEFNIYVSQQRSSLPSPYLGCAATSSIFSLKAKQEIKT